MKRELNTAKKKQPITRYLRCVGIKRFNGNTVAQDGIECRTWEEREWVALRPVELIAHCNCVYCSRVVIKAGGESIDVSEYRIQCTKDGLTGTFRTKIGVIHASEVR